MTSLSQWSSSPRSLLLTVVVNSKSRPSVGGAVRGLDDPMEVPAQDREGGVAMSEMAGDIQPRAVSLLSGSKMSLLLRGRMHQPRLSRREVERPEV